MRQLKFTQDYTPIGRCVTQELEPPSSPGSLPATNAHAAWFKSYLADQKPPCPLSPQDLGTHQSRCILAAHFPVRSHYLTAFHSSVSYCPLFCHYSSCYTFVSYLIPKSRSHSLIITD